MTIQDVMTLNPLSVDTQTRVSEVIKIMKEEKFDHLPVIDEANILVGIVSKSDLYRKALVLSQHTSGASYSSKILGMTRAEEIMTSTPMTLSPVQTIEYAIELLIEGDFHALPVTENKKLVGIVTSNDLLDYIVRNKT